VSIEELGFLISIGARIAHNRAALVVPNRA
jgi:hypothetical protein